MSAGSLQFTFPLIKEFAVSGFSTAEGVRQKWLQQQQHLRLVLILSLPSNKNKERRLTESVHSFF